MPGTATETEAMFKSCSTPSKDHKHDPVYPAKLFDVSLVADSFLFLFCLLVILGGDVVTGVLFLLLLLLFLLFLLCGFYLLVCLSFFSLKK